MPTIKVNNTTLNYEDSDPQGSKKPVMVFAHGLLWGTHLYDKQVAHFKDKYRCIRFDFRGQGKSKVTKSGYDMDTLCDDAIALIEKLNISKCHFIGLSMGGFVAQRVAIKRPDLLNTLILLETSADPEDPNNLAKYKALAAAIKFLGMKRVSKRVMPIMFGATFLADKSRKAEYKQWLKYLNANSSKGASRATTGVIERDEILSQLHKIDTPTLILVGDEDVATPYAKAQRMHFAIQGSKLAILKNTGHTATVESAEQVNANIELFLDLQK